MDDVIADQFLPDISQSWTSECLIV